MEYREQYGPFNQSIRFEGAIARAIASWRGGKAADFMPWPKQDEQPGIEGVFGLLKSSANKENRPDG